MRSKVVYVRNADNYEATAGMQWNVINAEQDDGWEHYNTVPVSQADLTPNGQAYVTNTVGVFLYFHKKRTAD